MEKMAYRNKSYKSVSGLENRVLEEASKGGLPVFGVRELQKITELKKAAVSNALASLSRKKILLRLFRDRYCVAEEIPEKGFEIATSLFAPCYVSFWSALSYYGFTSQQAGAIQVATTRQSKRIALPEIKIFPTTIRADNFFGYRAENGFSIATKEKALVDSLARPRQAGGMNEVAGCLFAAWGKIDKKAFFYFLKKTGNKSLNSRAGYLIEKMRLPAEKKLLEAIRKKSSKGFVRLNPQKKSSKEYDKKWKININERIEKERIF